MKKKIPKLLTLIFFLLVVETMAHSSSVVVSDESLGPNDSSQNTHSNQVTDISYSIEPFYDLNTFRLIVVLEFKGDKSGETKIILPNNIDINSIKYLKALSPNTFIIDTDRAEDKIVKHTPGSSVRIYYQVEEIRNGDLELGNQQMAIINRQYFHFLGESFFIIPGWDDNIELNLKIAWNHLPSNWNIANSFAMNEQYQEIKIALWKFKRAVFLGGDFKIRTRYIGSDPVYIATRGMWKFSEEQLSDLTRDILIEERNFWNDHSFPFFLLAVLPISGNDEQSGIVRLNSYSLFLSADRTIDIRLKRLLAHDIFHTWIGEKIQFAEPEQLVLWFKEGFTEYYTELLLLRAKLISLEEYVDHYNVILESYFTSPMREEKNERLIDGFGVDRDLTRLPYQRGQIFAHNLNYVILKNSSWKKSLDHLMRDLMSRCQNESLVISNGSLSALIRFYAGDPILSEIMRTLNSGAALKTIPEALGPCFKMEIDSRKKLIIFGEQYDIPSYKLKKENQQIDKSCISWFGVD
jgi:predicted metalloprotease with PDZ domain